MLRAASPATASPTRTTSTSRSTPTATASRTGPSSFLGTDPEDPDTNGDGVPDGEDLAPLNPNLSYTIETIPNGDLNGDGRFDVADVQLAMQIVRGEITPTPLQLAKGDVAPLGGPPDGQIDVADLMLFLRALRGDDLDGQTGSA